MEFIHVCVTLISKPITVLAHFTQREQKTVGWNWILYVREGILQRTVTVAAASMDPALFSAIQMYVPASCSETLEIRSRSSSKWARFRGKVPRTIFHDISGGGSPLATQAKETSLPINADVLAGTIVNCGRTGKKLMTHQLTHVIHIQVNFLEHWTQAKQLDNQYWALWKGYIMQLKPSFTLNDTVSEAGVKIIQHH